MTLWTFFLCRSDTLPPNAPSSTPPTSESPRPPLPPPSLTSYSLNKLALNSGELSSLLDAECGHRGQTDKGVNPDFTTYQLGISFLMCPPVGASVNLILSTVTLHTKPEGTAPGLSSHSTNIPGALTEGHVLFEGLGIQKKKN